jgi:maltooligosyltrehalose trehalohydrolase
MMQAIAVRRRFPVGAEVVSGGVHVRVWAPRARRVTVEWVAAPDAPAVLTALSAEADGYHADMVPGLRVGGRYRFRLDDDAPPSPDPASRYQPEGPHGPSEVVDPAAFRWSDADWPGVRLPGQVFYELHVGTFTREGTWAAAAAELPTLAETGVTVIELMPVAEFPGRFGWGYDGVDLFAPTRLYGRPDDFRRFVDRAHALGLAVILDVVYNHLGPDGCYLAAFSETYFTDRYATEWGTALNFDGPGAGPVRELFTTNAAYWIDEFHLDGLRLDATQSVHDASAEHVLAEVARAARRAAGRRSILLVAENEPQHVRLARRPEQGGYGMDALWNDDFHHSAAVALTGAREAYFRDYAGTAQELVSALKRGFLYQGQHYAWQRKRRGTPTTGVAPATFVHYLENHDQIANSLAGRRRHQQGAPGVHRALTALLLLGPATPLLFQGQEFAATSPFLYFADHAPDLAAAVRKGRREFLAQFPSLASPAVQPWLPDPGDPATFERCKLDHRERAAHREAVALHRDLLRLRREDPVLHAQRPGGVDGAVLGADALALRFLGDDGDDRLLLVNLGHDLACGSMAEPLLAPPERARWVVRWSSEDPRYGGAGRQPAETPDQWRLPGQAAFVLAPAPETAPDG